MHTRNSTYGGGGCHVVVQGKYGNFTILKSKVREKNYVMISVQHFSRNLGVEGWWHLKSCHDCCFKASSREVKCSSPVWRTFQSFPEKKGNLNKFTEVAVNSLTMLKLTISIFFNSCEIKREYLWNTPTLPRPRRRPCCKKTQTHTQIIFICPQYWDLKFLNMMSKNVGMCGRKNITNLMLE